MKSILKVIIGNKGKEVPAAPALAAQGPLIEERVEKLKHYSQLCDMVRRCVKERNAGVLSECLTSRLELWSQANISFISQDVVPLFEEHPDREVAKVLLVDGGLAGPDIWKLKDALNKKGIHDLDDAFDIIGKHSFSQKYYDAHKSTKDIGLGITTKEMRYCALALQRRRPSTKPDKISDGLIAAKPAFGVMRTGNPNVASDPRGYRLHLLTEALRAGEERAR